MISEAWIQNQINLITFVLVDAAGNEVTGLGNTFTLQVSKAGAAFAPSAGTKAEISNGWYSYEATAGEADTIGPVSIRVTGAGIVQQNLEYVVRARTAGCTERTYTVTRSDTGAPVPDAEVWFSTDIAGTIIVWRGTTDAFGVARSENGNLPCTDPGTYYVWVKVAGYTPDDWPDTEVYT